MAEKYQPIPHRLKNVAIGGHVAGAIDIYDDKLFKNQQDINENTYRKDETYSKEQLNNMITTPSQEYLSVTATAETTSVDDIATLIATKYPDGKESADTVYRVGCWDGEQYDTGVYTEYVWDGTQYIPVDVKEFGFDEEPTNGSDNLVKSGDIAKMISRMFSERHHNFDFVDKLGHILSFLDKDGWWNFPAMGIESFEFDPRGEESEYKILIVDSLNHVLAYRKPNENYVVVKKQEEDTKIYDRNADTIAIATGVAGVPSYNRLQFMIVTDTHIYPNAYVNALSIAKKLPDCAAVIHLGDVNNQVGVTGDVEEYYRKMFAENKAIYPVVGNHDVGEYDRLLVHVSVDKLLYNCSIQPMIDKGYLSEGEYVPNKLYYYKDFPTQKVRLIVLDNYNGSETLAENEYWEPVTYNSSYNLISQSSYTTGDYVNIKGYDKYSFKCTADVRVNYKDKTTSPSIKEYRRCCWYSEDQLEWLCNTLVGAAQNEYMCVIASHQVVVFPNLTDFDSEFTSQYAGDSINGYMSRFDENNITIISDIVKAFYEKDSVSKHMEAISSEAVGDDADDASSEPVFDFSYDFGESEYEPTRVTFIHGHNHRDSVCVPSDTETYPHEVSIGFTNADVTRSTKNNVGLLTRTNENNDILTAYTILDEDHIHLCRIGRNVTDRIVNGKVVVKDNQIVEI